MRGQRSFGARDALLTVTRYAAYLLVRMTMNSLPDAAGQSWFIVKMAVALSPILAFWAADVIGWFLGRTLWRRPVASLTPDVSRPAKSRPALQLRESDGVARTGCCPPRY